MERRRQVESVDTPAQRVARSFDSAVRLMQVMARACGHDHLSTFESGDTAAWHREMAELTGIAYAESGGQVF